MIDKNIILVPCDVHGCNKKVAYLKKEGNPPIGPHICQNHPDICPYGQSEKDDIYDETCKNCGNYDCTKPYGVA